MNRRILTLACAVALGALGAGCPGDECTLNSDCADGEQCLDKVCQKPSSACTPACGGGTPVCDEASKTCKVCTTGKGCPGGKICDTVVPQGACVDCLTGANCPTSAPVCSEDRTCVVCTEEEGCTGAEQCDLSVAGGRCVPTGCTVSADCSSTPRTPICDTTQRKCVVCTAAAGCAPGTNCVAGECTGCTADSQCPAATPACETTARRCVTCTATSGCSAGKKCDLSVAGGRCVDDVAGCSNDGDCASTMATPKCDLAAQKCVPICTATSGCATGVCDTSVTGGRCVDCRATADCTGGKVCDTSAQKCVTCLASNEGCSAGRVCDTGVAGGACVGCLNNGHCSGATPVCDTGLQACVTCTASAGCPGTQYCDLTVAGGQCKDPVGCNTSADCADKPGTPVCHPTSKTCVACTATEGCSGGAVCDTSVTGGACVECLSTPNCAAAGKVCDTAQKKCVTCLASNEGCVSPQVCDTSVTGGACVGCTASSHCGGATPVCDTTAKTCVGCLADATCAGQGKVCDTVQKACVTCTAAKGCTAPQVCDLTITGGQCITPVDCTTNQQCASKPGTPVCDLATNKCVACTATQGCSTGVCDTSVLGGRCVDCLSTANCTGGKVCDTAQNKCVTCTSTEGCTSLGKVCDTGVVGGACVECLVDGNCSGGKVCSPSQTCVTCTATKGCTGGKVCDLNVVGGACVGCLSSVHCAATPATPVCNMASQTCVTCTATEGCTNQGLVCDTAVTGGSCVGCLSNAHCGGATPVCNTATKTCAVCTASAGCAPGTVCNAAGTACVGCLSNANCGGATPICNPATNTCVTCTSTQGCTAPQTCNATGTACTGCLTSAHCAAPTPACNTSSGQCVVCLASNEGCGGATPRCKTSGPLCVQCLSDGDCAAGTCNLSTNTCTGSVDVSSQIAAARSAADAAGLTLPITGAYVTVVREQHGTGDPAGFFIQGSATGPALFVSDLVNAVPAPLAGDKVSFTITEMATSATLRVAKAISGYTRLSQGNFAAVDLLRQDLSNKGDVVSALGDYESEYISATGTLGALGYGGNGFSKFPFATVGMGATPTGFNFRVPEPIKESLDLMQGCNITLNKGVMWRYNADAQPSAYVPGDFVVTSCPRLTLTAAVAPVPTTVVLTFGRHVNPSSLLASGSQFSFSNGLVATAAAMGTAPNTVLLTTTSQVEGQSYTVTVASSLKDKQGLAVDPAANGAAFLGAGAPSGCSPGVVVISQVFSGGGSAGATYKYDFVELHNRSTSPQPLTGWSIQYASATGTFSSKIDLTGTIPAGGYYLVQTSGTPTATGLDLPTPDQIGTSINIAAASAKIALANSTTLLPACPDAGMLDLLGFGTATCSEGTALGALSSTTAALRNGNGCTDNNLNSSDFSIDAPAPRNSTSPALTCGCD